MSKVIEKAMNTSIVSAVFKGVGGTSSIATTISGARPISKSPKIIVYLSIPTYETLG
jgi:hypothetical protein